MLANPIIASNAIERHGHRWNPYLNHGGSVVAIAGEDFAIIGSDTRLSEDESGEILTRNQSKIYKLTAGSMLGLCGFHGDVIQLLGQLEYAIKVYKRENYSTISTSALANMLSCTLYNRRFFPLYVYNLLIGLDENGKGALYTFDPVGSYQREGYKAGGSGAAMLQPILDNQVGLKNQDNIPIRLALSKEKAMSLIRDSFISAAERDVLTGDGIIIHMIDKNGITTRSERLRND